MTYRIDPELHTGTPPTSGVYAIYYKKEPLHQWLVYFDGKSWGHGASTLDAALQGLRIGERLPFYKRGWWKTVATWQHVRGEKVDLVDVLKKAGK
jgi:hypothetical protein